jgi:hypothetical protein
MTMDPFDRLKLALADRYALERKIGGERFLMTKLPGEQPPPRIVVVLNWFEELRDKFPR